MLGADVLPVIPTQGSLGASGDLAPLAHMVLAMLGRSTVRVDGREEPAGEALQRFGIEPVALGPKEGLALINGTQFMAAYAVAIVLRAGRLAKHADVTATMSLEGINLGIILRYALPLLVHHSEVELCDCMPLLGGQAIPLQCLGIILRYALPDEVHLSDSGLCFGQPLLGG